MEQGTGTIRKAALEIFSIVLGVMLALGVSEWQEDRDRHEQAMVALDNIEHELRWNLKFLNRVHENNTATVASMDVPDEDTDDSAEVRSIIPALQLRETAYQTLLSTGMANHVEYKLILSLADTYSTQSVYKQIGQQLTEAAMSMAGYATVSGTTIDDEQFEEQFRVYFEQLVLGETQLLATYASSIEMLQHAHN
jgi:hypothetical protein